MDRIVPTLLVLVASLFVTGLCEGECPDGTFGPPDCDGECHCDSEPGVCDPVDGQCSIGLCERGWTSLPYCQLPCPDGTFGLNCDWTCHCPPGDLCSKVNGLCSSGQCEYGWGGPSCQTRLPIFACPVNTTTITSTSITVTWRRWSASNDIGNGPVVYYILEYQQHGDSEWFEASSRIESQTTNIFNHTLHGLEPYTAYRFRIIVGYKVGEKWVKSIPGVHTSWIYTKPVMEVEIATTATTTTTTEPTTTTASTTSTKQPTTASTTSTTDSTTTTTVTTTTTTPESTSTTTTLPTSTTTSTTTLPTSTTTSTTTLPTSTTTSTTTLPTSTTTSTTTTESTTTQIYLEEIREDLTKFVQIELHLVDRTESMLSIDWQAGNGSGLPWSQYFVKIEILETYTLSNLWSGLVASHVTNETSATWRDLPPATLFSVSVQPIDSVLGILFDATSGKAEFWTEPNSPLPLVQPSFISSTESTIELELFGLPGQNDPTVYQVLVGDLTLSNETIKSLLDEIDLEELYSFLVNDNDKKDTDNQDRNLHLTITAELPPDYLNPEGSSFTIGDQEYYGGYHNRPLLADHEYSVWVISVSRLDGVVKRAMVRMPMTVIASDGLITSDMLREQQRKQKTMIACLSILFTLLVIGVALGLGYYFWQKKAKNEQHLYDDIATYHKGMSLYEKYKAKQQKVQKKDIQHKIWTSTPTPNIGYPSPKRLKSPVHVDKIEIDESGIEIRVPKLSYYGADVVHDYYSVQCSNPISVSQLRKYCAERAQSDYPIEEEFRHLPIGMMDTIFTATKPENAMLNRSSQVLPYDKNRVKLKSIIPDDEPDYINASRVMTHIRTSFVVTQCPMETTLGEFWRLIWDDCISIIVALMALNEERKPQYIQYWPDVEDVTKFYHDISVTCCAVETTAYYVLRRFQISRLTGGEEEVRHISQYQYLAWTRGGVPTFVTPFLDFIDRIRNVQANSNQNSLVHCHTGSGRSGLYVALVSLISEGKVTGKVDVLKCVTTLRQERPNMVKHKRQYFFIYNCLVEYFMYHNTNIQAMSFEPTYENILNMNMNNSRPLLALEYDALDKDASIEPQQKRASIIKDFSTFVSPMTKHAIFNMGGDSLEHLVMPNSSDTDCSKLIPVYPNSYLEKDAFIITKYPTANQNDHLYDLIFDNSCSSIIVLNSEDCPQNYYYPLDCQDLILNDHIVSSQLLTETVGIPFEIRDIEVKKIRGRTQECVIRQFSFNFWLSHHDCPSVPRMVEFVSMIQAWRRGEKMNTPMLVMSSHGPSRAAVFCLAWSLLERMGEERMVNVFRAVRHYRNFVPTAINCASQYRFLYQCIKVFLSYYGKTTDASIEISQDIEDENTLPTEMIQSTQEDCTSCVDRQSDVTDPFKDDTIVDMSVQSLSGEGDMPRTVVRENYNFETVQQSEVCSQEESEGDIAQTLDQESYNFETVQQSEVSCSQQETEEPSVTQD